MNWFRNNNVNKEVISTPSSSEERAEYYASYLVNRNSSEHVTTLDPCLRSLCSCVDHVTTTCEARFRDLISQLSLANGLRYEDFSAMADELLVTITWERIITLFSFSVVLSRVLAEKGHVEHGIHKMLGSYLRDRVIHWIDENGGWERVCEEFGNDGQHNASKWAYVFLAGLGLGVGVGLIATYKLVR